jgi:hypothetical protein
MSTLQQLTDRGLIGPPRWLPGTVRYETIMGWVDYGVNSVLHSTRVGNLVRENRRLFLH